MSRLSRRTTAADLIGSSSDAAAEPVQQQDQSKAASQLSRGSDHDHAEAATAAAATTGKQACTPPCRTQSVSSVRWHYTCLLHGQVAVVYLLSVAAVILGCQTTFSLALYSCAVMSEATILRMNT